MSTQPTETTRYETIKGIQYSIKECTNPECDKVWKRRIDKKPKFITFTPFFCPKCGNRLSDHTAIF